MVNVTKENFIEESNDLIRHLPKAAFVAIDEEMTGISVTAGRPRKDQLPCERFPELKEAADTYNIIQFGVALFILASDVEENLTSNRGYEGVATAALAENSYVVRRYNFYTFPAAPGWNKKGRDVVMDPSSVAFLKKHNMSFDVWTGKGINYCTSDAAQDYLEKFLTRETDGEKGHTRSRIELRRQDDISFFARAMAGMREWLDAPVVNVVSVGDEGEVTENEDGRQYLLPACNAFMRRALYQHLEREYPSLILENGGNQQIRVLRLSPEEKKSRDERLKKEAWEKLILDDIGVWRVYEAIRRTCNGETLNLDSALFAMSHDNIDWEKAGITSSIPLSARRVPLVVHNGFMDLSFLISHFIGEIPDDYSDMKVLLRSQFPIIYDTKTVAIESPFGLGRESDMLTTSLPNVFEAIVSRRNDSGKRFLDSIRLCTKDNDSEQSEHEASYDAYLTGSIFAAILDKASDSKPLLFWKDAICDPSSVLGRSQLRRNVLHQLSIFNTDLESADPYLDPMKKGMSAESTFRVTGIDKSTGTRDIVKSLVGMMDSRGQPVNYEIIWVDDATFMVATCYNYKGLEPNVDIAPVLNEHLKILHERLKVTFSRQKIVSLSLHFAQKQAGPSWISGVLSALGFGKKRSFDGMASPTHNRKQVRRN